MYKTAVLMVVSLSRQRIFCTAHSYRPVRKSNIYKKKEIKNYFFLSRLWVMREKNPRILHTQNNVHRLVHSTASELEHMHYARLHIVLTYLYNIHYNIITTLRFVFCNIVYAAVRPTRRSCGRYDCHTYNVPQTRPKLLHILYVY